MKEKITDKESLIKEFVSEFGKNFAGTSGERSANLVFDILNPIEFLTRLLKND